MLVSNVVIQRKSLSGLRRLQFRVTARYVATAILAISEENTSVFDVAI